MLHTVSISNPDSFVPIKKETIIRMDLPQLFLCVLCISYCLWRKLLSGLHSSCWKNSSSWKVWQIDHLCHTVWRRAVSAHWTPDRQEAASIPHARGGSYDANRACGWGPEVCPNGAAGTGREEAISERWWWWYRRSSWCQEKGGRWEEEEAESLLAQCLDRLLLSCLWLHELGKNSLRRHLRWIFFRTA